MPLTVLAPYLARYYSRGANPMPMFQKENIDALFGELKRDYDDKDESEQLHRDAHLAIAYHDANRPLPDTIDTVVLDLIERYKPAE